MEPSKIIVRVVFAYIFLHVMMRLSGKRLVSEATPRDFVLALILGDMIDDLIWAEVGAGRFVVATGVLAMAQVVVGAAATVSDAAARLLNGKPEPLMRNGSPVRRGMRRERVNDKALAEFLRERGVEAERREEVEHAWLEVNGRASVHRHEWARPAERGDRERLDGHGGGQ